MAERSKQRGRRVPGVERGMAWMHRIRMRTLAFVVGVVIAGFGVAAAFTLPLIPVLGFAVAAAAVVVNQMASRLSHPTCYGCGRDIVGLDAGAYGVECPDCGAITQCLPRLAGRKGGDAPGEAAGPEARG